MKTLKTLVLLWFSTLAGLTLGPSAARADTLYTTQGNSLFQFNSAVGATSQTTISNFQGSITTAVTVDSHGNIFVATYGNLSTDFGDIYELATNGVTHKIATGLNDPVCLAVDSQGDLFEADANGGNTNINEFINTAGTLSSTPVTLSLGDGNHVNGLAFDSQGDLFAVDEAGIYEFTNDAGTLSTNATYFAPYGNFLSALAFDTNGDLFLSYGGPDIYEFINTAGTLSSSPVAFVFNSVNAYSLAFDSHNNLFFSDIATGNGNVYELNIGGLSINGGVVPTPPIFASGLYVGSLAFQPVIPPPPPPKLYVAGGESIYSFTPPADSSSEQTITNDLVFEPAAMAVDSQDNLFQSDGFNTIYEIPRKGVPLTFATGAAAVAFAFDTNGDLFASDGDNIYEFISNAGTLSTNQTVFIPGLECNGMAFDRKGNLFLNNGGQIRKCVNIGGTLSSSLSFFDAEGFYASMAFDANGDLFTGYADTFFFANPNQGAIQEYVFNNSANWLNGGVLSTKPITIATANVAALACDASGNLYEVDGDDGNVYEFANNGGTLSSTRTLYAGGLNATCEAMNPGFQPNIQTTNAKPNLYVGLAIENPPGFFEFEDSIYGFNSTNGAATKEFISSVGCCNDPIGSLAFDNNGNLYVGGDLGIYELTNHAGTLASNQTQIDQEGGQLGCGGGVAFDNSGNLFAGNYNYAGVNEFTATSTNGVWNNFPLGDPNPFLSGAGNPYCLAFDNARANLFVAGNGGAGESFVVEFGNLSGAFGTQTHLVFPTSIYGTPQTLAFDANGNLFVGGSQNISEYANTPTGVSMAETLFTSDLSDVTGLAFDASGNLFAADGTGGNIWEFINSAGVLSQSPVLFASGLGNITGLAIYIPPGPPGVSKKFHLINSFQPPNGLQPAQLVIAWPSAATGFVLQTNGTLNPSGWGSFTGPTNSNQGTNTVTIVPPSTGSLFFRLMGPGQ